MVWGGKQVTTEISYPTTLYQGSHPTRLEWFRNSNKHSAIYRTSFVLSILVPEPNSPLPTHPFHRELKNFPPHAPYMIFSYYYHTQSKWLFSVKISLQFRDNGGWTKSWTHELLYTRDFDYMDFKHLYTHNKYVCMVGELEREFMLVSGIHAQWYPSNPSHSFMLKNQLITRHPQPFLPHSLVVVPHKLK